MTVKDVGVRIMEVFGKTARDIQSKTVYEVGCQKLSILFMAKTGAGKSLTFEMVPLLDPNNPGIALIVMPEAYTAATIPVSRGAVS